MTDTFLRTSVFTEHLQWLLLTFLGFQLAPLLKKRNCLFHVKVAGFQQPDTRKNYFTSAFQAFYTKARSSYSKAFIYLKFLKIICEEVNL